MQVKERTPSDPFYTFLCFLNSEPCECVTHSRKHRASLGMTTEEVRSWPVAGPPRASLQARPPKTFQQHPKPQTRASVACTPSKGPGSRETPGEKMLAKSN